MLCGLPVWLHVFLHVALGWSSLSSHSRFSNLRIIERSYGRAAGLPAGFLGGLICDFLKGKIIADRPYISFSCLRLEPESRWVSWVVGWLGGTQRKRLRVWVSCLWVLLGRLGGPGDLHFIFILTFLSMVIHSIINTALQGAMQKQNLIITKIYNIPYLQ